MRSFTVRKKRFIIIIMIMSAGGKSGKVHLPGSDNMPEKSKKGLGWINYSKIKHRKLNIGKGKKKFFS